MAWILKSQITYFKSIYWGRCPQPFLAKVCLNSSSELWKRKVQIFLCCSKTHLSVKLGIFFLVFILEIFFRKLTQFFLALFSVGIGNIWIATVSRQIFIMEGVFFYLFSLLFFLDQTPCILPSFFQTVPENYHMALNCETNTLCFQLWMNKGGEKLKFK